MSYEAVDRAMQEVADAAVLPGFVAMARWRDGTEYLRGFGTRAVGADQPMTTDSVFRIASMSKAITSIAALLLVAEGRIALDTPVADILPRFGDLPILDGYDAEGGPVLRAATDRPTVFHLLTHTSGLSYPAFYEEIDRYLKATGIERINPDVAATLPRLFDCGERWEYGLNTDWLGTVIEAVEAEPLDRIVERRITGPLGMVDTGYCLDPGQQARLVAMHARLPDGGAMAIDYGFPSGTNFMRGGGGLFSTAPDYMKFLAAILDGALLPADLGKRLFTREIGDMPWHCLPASNPRITNRYDPMAGTAKSWSLGFLINTEAHPGGRAAGSGAWAGVFNCYYWVDPGSGVAGIFLSQLMPFADAQAVAAAEALEQAVYA